MNDSNASNDYTNCTVGTIREVHQRLLSEGFHITQHALRMWTKSGNLPAVYSGNKAYISYANAVSILTSGSTTHTN